MTSVRLPVPIFDPAKSDSQDKMPTFFGQELCSSLGSQIN